MNKFFTVLLLILGFHLRLAAQQFSQYNTGTVYDSFENPSQKAFTPDSSRKIAFNLFVPNFGLNFATSGNAQAALKSRAFIGSYDDRTLGIGKRNVNYADGDASIYYIMLKLYTNIQSNQELGFFVASKAEARGNFSDESVQIIADNTAFTKTTYNDIFNTHYNYQLYHQIGVTWREDLDRQVAFGIKLSALFGVVANTVDINRSAITFDRPNDQAFLSAAGNYQASFSPGGFTTHDLLPTTRNPGMSVSAGVGYTSDDHYKVQFNVKDLGFIHWNAQSRTGDFDNTGLVSGLSQPGQEDSLANTALSLVQTNSKQHSFTTPTNSKLEVSGSRSYWFDMLKIKYTPTVILSKELFYTGFTTAFVNHLQYDNLVGTVTASYNDMKYFNFGLQAMIKSPNAEFFIGCDRLPQTALLARSLVNSGSAATFTNSNYSGFNFFMGFSIKFGPTIDHASNTTIIPIEERASFAKRLWERITGRVD